MKLATKRFKDIKLRNKIMIIYICIGTIPMLLLGIYSYNQEWTAQYDKEHASIEDSLSQAVSQFNSQIMIYNNLSDFLAFNKPVSNVLTTSYERQYEMYEQYIFNVDPVLSSLQYFNPNIRQLTIYSDGVNIKHGTTVAPLKLMKEETGIDQSVITQNILWSSDRITETIYSMRKMPLMEQNGGKGVLYLQVDYKDIFNTFTSISQESYGLYVVDKNNTVVFGTSQFNAEQRDLNIPADKVLVEKNKADNNKKSRYIVVSKETCVDGWTAYLYRSDSMEGFRTKYLMVLFSGMFITCVITWIVASKAFSRFIVKDIEALRDNMLSVQNGNMELMVESDAKDEVGSLVRSFGSMLAELKRLIHEVYESKLAQKKYEMTALQAQINPHILYNSLSLINWKALEAGQEDISKLTLSLSTFYRTSLNRGSNILTIEKEIENMKSYLEIQKFMHDDEFDVIMDIDDDILQYNTLNLVLQPLVENSIEHGISLKEDGRGYIKIIGRKDESKNCIYLMVEDNGVGIEPKLLETILEFKTRGYGVRNVNQRIKLYYGEAYSLNIESKLDEGTKCTICIPMNDEDGGKTDE